MSTNMNDERSVRAMSRADRVAHLRAAGWTRIDSAGAQTWRSPDGAITGTLAYAIRRALGVNMTPTKFGTWLRRQAHRQDAVGDLARDYSRGLCRCCPDRHRSRPTGVEGIRADMDDHNAVPAAYEALDMAAREWRAARGVAA